MDSFIRQRLRFFFLLIPIYLMYITGCSASTHFQWKPVGEATRLAPLSPIYQTSVSYEVGSMTLEGQKLIINIKKKTGENKYNSFSKIQYKKISEYRVEEKKSLNATELLGAALLMAAPWFYNIEPNESDTESTINLSPTAQRLIISSVIGLLVIPYLVHSYNHNKSVKEYLTGNTKEEIVSETEIKGDLIERRVVSEGEPAAGVLSKLTGTNIRFLDKDGRYSEELVVSTDSAGNLTVNTDLPEYFSTNRGDLVYRLSSSPMIKSLRTSNKNEFIGIIKELLEKKYYTFRVETLEKSKSSLEVQNAVKEFNIEGYEFNDTILYNGVKEFVDLKINSKIQSLTFEIRDYSTNTRIPNAILEIKNNIPDAIDVASEYFPDDMLNIALDFIKIDLPKNKKMVANHEGMASFNWYLPKILEIEILHPKYNPCKTMIKTENDNKYKIIYLSELGTKNICKVVDK